MLKPKVTSYTVAREAGVSQTTVSLVLNKSEKANISDEVRQRVIKVAQELNYVPHALARSLVTGKAGIIAFIASLPVENIALDSYLSKVIQGLNEVCQQRDFHLIIDATPDYSKRDKYTTLAKNQKVDGLITSNIHAEDKNLLDLIRNDYPVVVLNKIPETNTEIQYSVIANDAPNTYQVIAHLLELGHERIGCIPYTSEQHINERLNIFRTVLADYGVDYDANLVQYGNYTAASGYQAMTQLLGVKNPATAVFATNDMMAVGAMAAIRDHGLNIPQDISIVGCDNEQVSSFTYPPLTTVDFFPDQVGKAAAHLLLDIIEGKEINEPHVVIDSQLVIRSSASTVE